MFGEKSLHMRCPGGASGHETDKVSPSSPTNVDGAGEGARTPTTAGRRWSTFDTPSGGAVFSVGSISYVASLPVDEHVSRITANVLQAVPCRSSRQADLRT